MENATFSCDFHFMNSSRSLISSATTICQNAQGVCNFHMKISRQRKQMAVGEKNVFVSFYGKKQTVLPYCIKDLAGYQLVKLINMAYKG